MKNLNYSKIEERLRKLRAYLGLTQEQIADILNVDIDVITRIERGDRKINLQELIAFSKLYSIDIDELISDEYKVSNADIKFVEILNKLSKNDKKKIINLIRFKNKIKNVDSKF